MKRYLLILFAIICFTAASGQAGKEDLTGQVTYVTSGSVYVRFKSTAGIAPGDTLFSEKDGKMVPQLIVSSLSSISCVCVPVPPARPAVSDFVIRRAGPGAGTGQAGTEMPPATAAVAATAATSVKAEKGPESSAPETPVRKQQIRGNVSVNSYSDFSNTTAENSQRFRYTLSLDARNIAGSKFSFETYASFRHKTGEWEEVKNNVFSALKIFNLALVYEPDKTSRITLGRRINPKLSNIGAADGLQAEKSFGRFSIGALAGTRPDYEDYGFNVKLFQFGGYAGFRTGKGNKYSESSVAFMQQMNGSATDRRFIYFQHSNSLVKNLYFIGTLEADLYKLTVDTVNNTEKAGSGFDLTGLYLSLRYRLSDRISITGSYDARKNVIYYETYKTFMDRILEDGMRQGYRMNVNYRITRFLTMGLNGGYRFLKSDPHPARNLYGYLTYASLPGIGASVTVSGTYLESAYTNGMIYGGKISRDLFRNRMQAEIGYHYVDYTLPENSLDEIQHIAEACIYWYLPWKLSLGVSYEGTFEQANHYNRIYAQVRKRF
jgi:hypothetical protein